MCAALGMLIGALILVPASTASAQESTVAVYPGFSQADLAGLQLNGSAVLNGDALRLTPATGGLEGSVFMKAPVAQTGDGSFSTQFAFGMSNAGPYGMGADGIVFVLQSSAGTATALGGGGGDIGYGGTGPGGSGGIPNSLGVEFDTYNDANLAPWDQDPNNNHVGIDLDGSVTSSATATPTCTMSPGYSQVSYAWIDYSGLSHLLSVYLSDTDARPAAPLLSRSIDLADHIGSGDIYAGFTASTGGAWQDQDLLSWSLSVDSSLTSYTLVPAAGAHGTISPSTTQTVGPGGTGIFTIKADDGYHISDVFVDGVSVGASSSVTFSNVVADHTVSATFAFTPIATRLTITSNKTTVVHGHPITLSGTISSGPPRNTPIVVYARKPGSTSWVKVFTCRSTSAHRWSGTYSPPKRGTWYFEARFAGTATYAASTSASKKITVK